MPREDIVRGLEGAMSKGETLERAMYSFYNAGYRREDVEEAARALSIHLSQQESLIPSSPVSVVVKPKPIKSAEIQVQIPPIVKPSEISKPKKESVKPEPKKTDFVFGAVETPKPTLQPLKEVQKMKPKIIEKKPEVIQEVSAYEQKQKLNPRTILIILLSIVLVILLISLTGIFVFREALLNLFNNMF